MYHSKYFLYYFIAVSTHKSGSLICFPQLWAAAHTHVHTVSIRYKIQRAYVRTCAGMRFHILLQYNSYSWANTSSSMNNVSTNWSPQESNHPASAFKLYTRSYTHTQLHSPSRRIHVAHPAIAIARNDIKLHASSYYSCKPDIVNLIKSSLSLALALSIKPWYS